MINSFRRVHILFVGYLDPSNRFLHDITQAYVGMTWTRRVTYHLGRLRRATFTA